MKKKVNLRVVIIVDSAELADRAIAELGTSFAGLRYIIADTSQALVQEIKSFLPDLIISDFDCLFPANVELLELISQNAKEVPLVFLSRNYTVEHAIEAMRAGAMDFIDCNDLSRLNVVIRRVLSSTSLAKHEKKKLNDPEHCYSENQTDKVGYDRSTLESKTELMDSQYAGNQSLKATIARLNLEIQECKRIESALRETEDRYHTLFNEMTEGFAIHEIVCDDSGKPVDYKFLDINPAFEHLTGLKREEVVGRLKSDVLPGEDPIWVEKYGQVALTGNSVRFNSYAPVLKRYYDVLSYRTEPGRFAVLFSDITDLKRATEALHRREFILAQAGRIAQLGAWDIDITDHDDINNNTLRWSDEVYRIFGYEPGEIQVSNDVFFEHVHPDDRAYITEAIAKAIAESNTYQIEHRIIRKDGSERYVLEYAELTFHDDGRLKSIVGAVQDITDRKQAEEQLIKLETEKRHQEVAQVIERSAKLASIGVIAGGITHEINQPLNAIRVGSQGILLWNKRNQNVLPGIIVEMLSGILESVMRIDQIVKSIRTFWTTTDIETLEIVDLNEVVSKVVLINEQKLKNHGIFLNLELYEGGLYVSANQLRLELVVNNLLINAIHALDKSAQKNRTILISSYKVDKHAYVQVRDNGIGLDPGITEKQLFDPFFTTKSPEEGSGLGLAIVKTFLERYKATISANNNESGGGACFTLRFEKANRS